MSLRRLRTVTITRPRLLAECWCVTHRLATVTSATLNFHLQVTPPGDSSAGEVFLNEAGAPRRLNKGIRQHVASAAAEAFC